MFIYSKKQEKKIDMLLYYVSWSVFSAIVGNLTDWYVNRAVVEGKLVNVRSLKTKYCVVNKTVMSFEFYFLILEFTFINPPMNCGCFILLKKGVVSLLVEENSIKTVNNNNYPTRYTMYSEIHHYWRRYAIESHRLVAINCWDCHHTLNLSGNNIILLGCFTWCIELWLRISKIPLTQSIIVILTLA